MTLSAIKKHARLLTLFFKFSFLKYMAFRFNFFFGYLIDVGWLIFTIIFLNIFYSHITNIAGWTYGEILVLIGTFWISQSFIYGLVIIFNIRQLPKIIWEGNLDLILLKPVNSQFMVSTQFIWTPIFLNLFLSVWLIYSGLQSLHLLPSLINFLNFLIANVSGLVIVYSLWFMVTCLAFFIDNASNLPFLPQAIVDNVTQYPTDIFKNRVLFLFTWFLPLAFVVTIPTKILLGKISIIYAFYSLILAIIFIYISHLFWQFCLKHYASASS